MSSIIENGIDLNVWCSLTRSTRRCRCRIRWSSRTRCPARTRRCRPPAYQAARCPISCAANSRLHRSLSSRRMQPPASSRYEDRIEEKRRGLEELWSRRVNDKTSRGMGSIPQRRSGSPPTCDAWLRRPEKQLLVCKQLGAPLWRVRRQKEAACCTFATRPAPTTATITISRLEPTATPSRTHRWMLI